MLKRKASSATVVDNNNNDGSCYGHGKRWLRGELIGKGDSGASVFMATLKKPKRTVFRLSHVMAVKSAEESVSRSLLDEKWVLDNLQDCPFIVKCLGDETTRGGEKNYYNVVLEYAHGGTLAEKIKNGALLEDEARVYTRCMVEALHHVHASGFIHRDLKPENLILVPKNGDYGDGSYIAKISDFGCAKNVKRLRKMKIEPYLRGNIRYLSPEAAVASKQGPESDVWALGCVVFEMLTGKSIWEEVEDEGVEEGLINMGLGIKHQLRVPVPVSDKAMDFMKACFGANNVSRWSAEMLLDHPFVAGVNI